MDVSNECFFSNFDDYNKIGFLLWKLDNYWQREFKKKFAELKLNFTHSQVLLLVSIMWGEAHEEVDITQKTLSDKTGIDPMTTSTILRTLQKKKLIRRKFYQKDSRMHLISLTEEGKGLVGKALQIVGDFNHSFFSPLKEQQKQFQENLIVLLMKDDAFREHIMENHKEELKKYNNITF
ncbi:MAG: MarR family transcriptional regulator [Flavobacteriaceae bacterium]|nr:MarR family transcriptional regulator [Flavobacteriaceae bacterium]